MSIYQSAYPTRSGDRAGPWQHCQREGSLDIDMDRYISRRRVLEGMGVSALGLAGAALLGGEQLAQRTRAMRTTGCRHEAGFDDGRLPCAIRPPEQLWAGAEGNFARTPASDVAQHDALYHRAPSGTAP